MPSDVRAELVRSVKQILNIVGATGTTVPSETGPVSESDGTIRVSLVGWDGGIERVAVTTDGILKTLTHGEVASTVTALELEAAGGLQTLIQGKDSGGNLDPLRTNPNQQLQIEVIDNRGSQVSKILGTSDPAVTTNTNLYTTPASTTTEITLFSACNRSGSTVTIRVGIDVGGAGTNAPDDSEWLYYDMPVLANDTLILSAAQGIWLATTDDLVVYASASDMSFILSGTEYA